MSTYVFIHGAWFGGWCWQRVAKILLNQGHNVYTPTLTGLGERSHLISQQIDLSTHIADIVNVIIWEDLNDIVLCGHSYGGMITTAVADRLTDRIRALVYMDAMIPKNGDSMFDLLTTSINKKYKEKAEKLGQGWLIPKPSAKSFGITNPQDQIWIDSKTTDQPLITFEQPVSLTAHYQQIKNCIYIAAEKSHIVFQQFFNMLTEQSIYQHWQKFSLPTEHLLMITMPENLVKILSSI